MKNGRLGLDEPTDLAEGSEVPLEIAPDWDELEAADLEALYRDLDQSVARRAAGAPTRSVEEVLAKLDAQR